ncbi:MAG: EAL domain-containing protein [Treponema sp.]|nr:EAL domain-containing protein [Treponema sp.]
MNYNYFYEIAAAIICLVLLLDILYKRQSFRKDARLFTNVVVTQGLLSVVDFVSCILLDNATSVPYWLNMLFIELYFFLQPVLLYSFVAFIVTYPESQKQTYKVYKIIAGVIFLVDIIIGITSSSTGWYFIFDKAELVYYRGIHRMTAHHFYYAACIMVFLFMVQRFYSFLNREKMVIVLGSIIIAVSVTAQSRYHLSLITGLGTSITILLLYITMENPNSYIDRRTGINNAEALRVFINHLDASRQKYAVCTIRITRYDSIERAYGYEKINQLMLEICGWLGKGMNFKNRIFRLSEDNIVVVMKGNQSDFVSYAEKINERFAKKWKLREATEILVEAKIAVCEYPSHFNNFSSFLEMKDFLIFSPSKHSLVIADGDTMKQKIRFTEVEEAVRRALDNETLEVFYQPIYDAKARKIGALEALARMTDEKLGFVSPEEFIPVAESVGLIYDLGLLVVKKVCQFSAEKLLRMENNPVEKIEINLSQVQLLQRDTIPTIKKIVEEYNIPPDFLNFEITESATADTPEVVTNAMNSLIEFGCDFSLDDYGTGYSNITHMLNFQFEKIKFDRQLVSSYFKERSAKIILGHEFEIIQDLNKEIVVEGIENEEYFQQFLLYDVRYYQGYYFSKALPEDDIISYLKMPSPAEMF